jgi:hypothetical protein
MAVCMNCSGRLKRVEFGWAHIDPIDGNDPRICFYSAIYAQPEEA